MQRLLFVVILATFLVVSLLLGLSCTPQTTLGISVTELDNGVFIENISNVDSLVFVNSPDGERRFELAVGENRTVAGISQLIEVSAGSQ